MCSEALRGREGSTLREVSIDRIRELTAGFKERSYVSYTLSANYKAIATPKFVEGLLPRPRAGSQRYLGRRSHRSSKPIVRRQLK